MQSSGDSAMTAAMRAYLDKLKEIVPMCPKNRNISKLELIQHVIDYINDLQDTLENSGANSPPPSPTPDPISFTVEAFSQLGFGESPLECKEMTHYSQDSVNSAALACCSSNAYTSDGASDYDSRGSSPVNSHSDTDYSSDELQPVYNQHHRMMYSGATPKIYNNIPHDYNQGGIVYRTEQKRHYRRGYEYPMQTQYRG